MDARALSLLATLLLPSNAFAWGLVVPETAREGGQACVHVREHAVEAVAGPDGARATTRLTFVSEVTGPATLLFPEVAGGAPSATLDGYPVALIRLDASRAAEVLAGMAARRPTPALMAAAGGAVWTATVDLAQGEHQLTTEGAAAIDWSATPARLIVPLRDLGTACSAPGVHVKLTLESRDPIGTVFTPYHDRTITRTDPRHVVIESFTQTGAQCHDFHAYVSAADAPVATSLVSYRAAACSAQASDDNPGYVLLAAGATVMETREADAKDIVMVIDTSGSMGGEKIAQVRQALASILSKLSEGDRFDLITFANDARSEFSGLVAASDAEKLAQARALASSLEAGGGTNINDALLRGLSELGAGSAGRPRMILFLTDGAATAGVTDNNQILANVARANEVGAKVYVFGVGYDVNTALLDSLSRQNGGATHYIRPGASIDSALSAFYASIQAPVATDLQLGAEGVTVRDLYPEKIPDLFVGGDAFLTGRYGHASAGRVTLFGRTGGAMAAFTASGSLLEVGTSHAFLPRLWASRRLGQLLYEARQNGGAQATVDEIRAIALRHGFVTPFTPFRVNADGALDRMYSQPTSEQSGENAVGTSGYINTLSGNSNAAAYGAMGGNGVAPIRQVLDRTFILDKGVWLDTTAPEKLDDAQVIDIAFMGEAWRKLAGVSAEARELLSVGRNQVFVWRCAIVRVTESTEEKPVTDEALPPELLAAGSGDGEVAIPSPTTPPPARPEDVVPGDLELAKASCAAAGATADGWALAAMVAGLALVLARRKRSP